MIKDIPEQTNLMVEEGVQENLSAILTAKWWARGTIPSAHRAIQSVLDLRRASRTSLRKGGYFLNTPESFNDTILQSFMTFSPNFRIQDSMINGKPNAPWNSFNDFFDRELNP